MFLMQIKTGIQAVANCWDIQLCILTECKIQKKMGGNATFCDEWKGRFSSSLVQIHVHFAAIPK